MTRLLTIPQASRQLGLDARGRRLARLLAAVERRTGRRIGIRTGQRRTQWRVTEALLRRYLPELYQAAEEGDEFRRTVRAHLRDVERKAEDTAREVAREEVAGVRVELRGAVLEVASGVGKLERRVRALESGESGGINAETIHATSPH